MVGRRLATWGDFGFEIIRPVLEAGGELCAPGLGVVPHDDTVYQYDAEGKPSVTVPGYSPVKQAVHRIFDGLTL